MLRNILNFSAQETNVSLERLQRNLGLLMAETGHAVDVGLPFFREDLNDTVQNNSICLTNLRKLREGLRTRIGMLSSHVNSRNTRLQTFLNALNEEVEILNNMEAQLTSTSTRIEALRNDLSAFTERHGTRQTGVQLDFSQSSVPSDSRDDEASPSTSMEAGRPEFNRSHGTRTGSRRRFEVEDTEDEPPRRRRRRLEGFHRPWMEDMHGNF